MSQDEVSIKLNSLLQLIEIDMNSSANAGGPLKSKAIWMKITTIILSGLITVTLGWTFLGDLGKWIAIFLSSALTSLNSWDAYKNYDKRLLQETYNSTGLKLLYQDIMLYLAGNESPEMSDYKAFKKRYDDLHNEYLSERKSLEKEKSLDNKSGK